ncbi:MAG TPA: hypothetical protein VFD70_30460 [Anaerolineae bacterium]|nr:hypothetical protein [Anaerolineae bacterium]
MHVSTKYLVVMVIASVLALGFVTGIGLAQASPRTVQLNPHPNSVQNGPAQATETTTETVTNTVAAETPAATESPTSGAAQTTETATIQATVSGAQATTTETATTEATVSTTQATTTPGAEATTTATPTLPTTGGEPPSYAFLFVLFTLGAIILALGFVTRRVTR